MSRGIQQFQCIPKNNRAVVFLYGLLNRQQHFLRESYPLVVRQKFRMREELIHLDFNAIPRDCKGFANFS